MCNHFVKREQLSVRFEDLLRAIDIRCLRPSLQGLGCFVNDWVGQSLTGYFPKGDESIDRSGKADLEDTPIARSTWGLEIKIKWPVIAVSAEQHQHVQPVERIDKAHRKIYVMFQTVAVIDIEVP